MQHIHSHKETTYRVLIGGFGSAGKWIVLYLQGAKLAAFPRFQLFSKAQLTVSKLHIY